MSDAIFACLIVVIVLVVFCCCGLLVTLVLSRTLCKPEKESNKPTAIEQNQDIMFTESERKNLEDFNIALINILSQVSRHGDTSDTVKQRIKTLLPDIISSPPQTSHHQNTRQVRTDERPETPEPIVSDNRSHTKEPLYDEPTNPPKTDDNKEFIDRYVTQYPVARQEYIPEVECQNNPSYETSTNEPNELRSLLQSKLPGAYDKFKELTDYFNSN